MVASIFVARFDLKKKFFFARNAIVSSEKKCCKASIKVCGAFWVRKVPLNNCKNDRNRPFKLFGSAAAVSCRENVNKGNVELWFFDLLKGKLKAFGLGTDLERGQKRRVYPY